MTKKSGHISVSFYTDQIIIEKTETPYYKISLKLPKNKFSTSLMTKPKHLVWCVVSLLTCFPIQAVITTTCPSSTFWTKK